MISDYVKREQECEQAFHEQGRFWHLYTSGKEMEMIFKSDDDFKYGITSSAMSLHDVNIEGKGLKLYAFALMSNHVHNLLCGSEEDCRQYFSLWKGRLQRYFAETADLTKFKCEMQPIDDVQAFRFELAYINRNGYVNNLRELPFSYEWSSGRYHFNPAAKEITARKVSGISCRDKKKLFRTRLTDSYDSMMLYKDYISPLCFCEIEAGECLFNTPHQYFKCLTKAVEEYSSIARKLGENVFLNDGEMFNVAYRMAKEVYKADDPKLLGANDKIEMAKIMRKKYNASNSQIFRILKLDKYIIESLFSKPL